MASGPAASPPKEEVADKTIEALSDYAALVSDFASNTDTLWFRGASSPDHHLVPSLYRRLSIADAAKAPGLERDMISAFRFRAPPFLQTPLPAKDEIGDLETLFIMQHFGIPTRLLDWTENPFVALYFALKTARLRQTATSDAVVWCLAPTVLNSTSLAMTSLDVKRVLPIDSHALNGYRPGSVGQRMPIAIYGVHNSPRIVAQRGVFVLFGSDVTPMDEDPEFVKSNGLFKIKVKKEAIDNIYSTLFKMGFTDSVVFPDLDGLAKEISFQHGY